MYIIKMTNPTHPLKQEKGEIIHGLTSIEWTERYRESDDFKLTAPTHRHLRDTLPIGSMITHMNSDVIMIVENHELKLEKNKPAEDVVSGRSLEAILDYRVMGAYHHWDGWPSPAPNEYIQPHLYPTWTGVGKSYRTAEVLANGFLNGDSATDQNDKYSTPNYFLAWSGPALPEQYPMLTSITDWKSDEGAVLPNLIKCLEIDNFGMRVERPERGVYHDGTLTVLYIHPGRDKSREVVLSHQFGDIERAEYLWSDKSYYNTAYIRTHWQAYMKKDPNVKGIDRRMIYVDYKDIDSSEDLGDIDYPDAAVINGCRAKTREVLNANKLTEKVSVEIVKDLSRYKYRSDFKVGDLITVDLEHVGAEVKRVVEYVEIEDENGESGYPVLDAPNDKVFGHG